MRANYFKSCEKRHFSTDMFGSQGSIKIHLEIPHLLTSNSIYPDINYVILITCKSS